MITRGTKKSTAFYNTIIPTRRLKQGDQTLTSDDALTHTINHIYTSSNLPLISLPSAITKAGVA